MMGFIFEVLIAVSAVIALGCFLIPLTDEVYRRARRIASIRSNEYQNYRNQQKHGLFRPRPRRWS